MFTFSKVRFFSDSTFYKIQRKILQPVINEFWKLDNKRVILEANKQPYVEVCGDAQCDSPGHTAKYGIYSMMNKKNDQVLSMRVTHVSEAGNSNAMEKFGMIENLKYLRSLDVNVKQITIDRHVSCRKYIVEKEQDIELQFDVWHVSNSVKKLTKLAKKRSCALLGEWTKVHL